MAAWTVAFGIHANPKKAFSLNKNFYSPFFKVSLAATTVPTHLMISPKHITPTPFPKEPPLIFLNYTAAPTVANTKGWQKVQKNASSFSGFYSPHT